MSHGFGEHPHEAPASPQRKSRWPMLVGCGCLSLVVLSIVGIGVLYLAYVNLTSADLLMQLRDHPQVQQHLGEIEEVQFNFSKTVNTDSDQEEVFDVTGSKTNGELTVVTVYDDQGDMVIERASIRVNGEVIELDLTLLD